MTEIRKRIRKRGEKKQDYFEAIKLNLKFVKLLRDFAIIIKCLDVASMKQEEDLTVSSKKPYRSNLSL